MVIQRHVKLVKGLLMLHGQLPLRLMMSAIAVRTSSRTIATVHRFTPPIKYVYILIF